MIVYTGMLMTKVTFEKTVNAMVYADKCRVSFASTAEQARNNRDALRTFSNKPVKVVRVCLERAS